MSFLITETDTTATLEELFAFIDSSQNECSERREVGDSNADVNEEPLTPAAPAPEGDCRQSKAAPNTTRPRNTPKRRRKRIGWSSSTGLQRRKRAELEFLRQHVVDLGTYVQKLQLPVAPRFDGVQLETPYQWQEFAMVQLAARLRSEEENRLLKGTMSTQLRMHEDLKRVFEDSGVCTNNSRAVDVYEPKLRPTS